MAVQHLQARSEIELRQTKDGKSQVAGHAAVFFDESRFEETTFELPRSGLRERIMRGAFDQSLASDDEIVALNQHDKTQPLARRSAGTLQLSTDERGLSFLITLAETTRARDLVADIQAGNVTGASFGFTVRQDGAQIEDEMRTLTGVKLIEISPVTFPAFSGTDVFLRMQPSDEDLKWGDWQQRKRRARTLDLTISPDAA